MPHDIGDHVSPPLPISCSFSSCPSFAKPRPPFRHPLTQARQVSDSLLAPISLALNMFLIMYPRNFSRLFWILIISAILLMPCSLRVPCCLHNPPVEILGFICKNFITEYNPAYDEKLHPASKVMVGRLVFLRNVGSPLIWRCSQVHIDPG